MDEGIDQLQALLSQINVNFTGIPSVSLVRVDTINPTKAAFEKIAQKFPDYGTRSEIDFDDTTDDADLRDANRLTIRTRFLYPMKIPFANYIIHKAFMAQSAGVLLSGPIFSRRLPNQQWNTNSAADMTIQSRLPGSDPVQWIFGDKDLTILRVLWELGKQGIYMVPLRATAAMRMQSNIFKDNLQ
jgi:hypothetical protein